MKRGTVREARERGCIIQLRVAAGYTHQEIAAELGIDRSTVTYYATSTRCKSRPEHKRPRAQMLSTCLP